MNDNRERDFGVPQTEARLGTGSDPYGLDDPVAHDDNETGFASDWAVPWSDLMMVMFVLFAVMFAYQLAERDIRAAFEPEADEPVPAAPVRDLAARAPVSAERLLERTREAIRETDLDDVAVELQADDSIKLSIRGPLFFDLGTAELRPPTRRFLDRVAEVLRTTPFEVRVVGHTDNFPVSSAEFPTNWELSAVRATTVARYLIDRGVEADRFSVVGHSMYRPAAPNDSRNNRAMNRRVEIVITREIYNGLQAEAS